MQLYMSGTPRNDAFQPIENRLCSHRLFSMYRDYAPQVMKWLDAVRRGIVTVDDYLRQYPAQSRILSNRDREYRERMREQADDRDWVPLEDALRRACSLRQGSHPRNIMLDSGAFTAWKSRKSVALKDVIECYSCFLRESDGLFDSVWLINLDVITDDNTTGEQRTEAFRRSDENFCALTAEFGSRVLPVFHQGEGKDRLREILDQADGFLCLSPNNKKPEDHRYRWTRLANYAVRDMGSKARAHGLATTGNVMIREAGLFSGDSAAWVEHGKFGTVDLVQAEFAENILMEARRALTWELMHREVRRGELRLRYQSYHISRERNDRDKKTGIHLNGSVRHYSRLHADQQRWVVEQIERYGFPFVTAQWVERVRSLICMAELDRFSQTGTPLSVNAEPIITNSAYAVL